MVQSLFILPNGTRITSGPDSEIAVVEVRLLRRANTASALRCGSACAAELEAEFLDPNGRLSALAASGPWSYLRDDGTAQTHVGLFWPQSITRPSPNRVRVTAKDAMTRLDRDLSAWLSQVSPWPDTLKAMLEAVCLECGLDLASTDFPNASLPLVPFRRRTTGRQLVQWIAEAAARFAFITPGGALSLGAFASGGELTLPVRQRTAREQPTDPIGSVEVSLRQGGVCRRGTESGTVYRIRENPMLEALSEEALAPAVETLARELEGISYTPGQLQVWDPQWQCRPGTFLTTVDHLGRRYDLGVFRVTHRGNTAILESAASAAALGETSLEALSQSVEEAEEALACLQTSVTALESTAGEHAQTLALREREEETLEVESARCLADRQLERDTARALAERVAQLEAALGAAAAGRDLAALTRRLAVRQRDGAAVSLTLSGSDSGPGLLLGEDLRWPALDPATTLNGEGLHTRALACDALTLGRFTLRPTATTLRLIKTK